MKTSHPRFQNIRNQEELNVEIPACFAKKTVVSPPVIPIEASPGAFYFYFFLFLELTVEVYLVHLFLPLNIKLVSDLYYLPACTCLDISFSLGIQEENPLL